MLVWVLFCVYILWKTLKIKSLKTIDTLKHTRYNRGINKKGIYMELTAMEKQIMLNALGTEKKNTVKYMYNNVKDQEKVDASINYINYINGIIEKLGK